MIRFQIFDLGSRQDNYSIYDCKYAKAMVTMVKLSNKQEKKVEKFWLSSAVLRWKLLLAGKKGIILQPAKTAIYLHGDETSIQAQKFPPERANHSPDDSINKSHNQTHFKYIGKFYIPRCQKKKKDIISYHALTHRINWNEKSVSWYILDTSWACFHRNRLEVIYLYVENQQKENF